MERRDWVNAKRMYLHTDATYPDVAAKYGISRQAVIQGFRREFPSVDWQERKKELKLRRDAELVAKAHEQGEISRLRLSEKLDATDDKHLELINMMLDKAAMECESGVLKAKSIRDIIDLMRMHRDINHKRSGKTEIIVIGANLPNGDNLPVIDDVEFEVEDV